ncbi:hypothetical protein H5410_005027, partial [Solanum commersonii]
MIIPKKIEKQNKIQKIEIVEFYARKRVIGLATILNELATNYLNGNTIWSYYAREQTMKYSNCRETRPADMEEIRQWVLSLLKPEQKPTTRAIRQNFISTVLMANYCKTIGHKYPDYHCSKCYGEDNIIPPGAIRQDRGKTFYTESITSCTTKLFSINRYLSKTSMDKNIADIADTQ